MRINQIFHRSTFRSPLLSAQNNGVVDKNSKLADLQQKYTEAKVVKSSAGWSWQEVMRENKIAKETVNLSKKAAYQADMQMLGQSLEGEYAKVEDHLMQLQDKVDTLQQVVDQNHPLQHLENTHQLALAKEDLRKYSQTTAQHLHHITRMISFAMSVVKDIYEDKEIMGSEALKKLSPEQLKIFNEKRLHERKNDTSIIGILHKQTFSSDTLMRDIQEAREKLREGMQKEGISLSSNRKPFNAYA